MNTSKKFLLAALLVVPLCACTSNTPTSMSSAFGSSQRSPGAAFDNGHRSLSIATPFQGIRGVAHTRTPEGQPNGQHASRAQVSSRPGVVSVVESKITDLADSLVDGFAAIENGSKTSSKSAPNHHGAGA